MKTGLNTEPGSLEVPGVWEGRGTLGSAGMAGGRGQSPANIPEAARDGRKEGLPQRIFDYLV